MKPRLESLVMTNEDTAIWCQVFLKAGGWPEWSHGRFQRSDRRDADLMLALAQDRAQGTCYLHIGRENAEVPIVHVFVRKNPLWPSL